MQKNSKIYIAGHNGMVGSSIHRQLIGMGFRNLITKTREELDLTNQAKVNFFFKNEAIDYVILAAAKVGGIQANNIYPADFIYINTIIQANLIHAAFVNNIKRLLFLGSSCIYPKNAKQPMREDSLLTSTLESTNEPYAIAKIAGIKLCESYNRQYGTDFRSVMPTNLYGINDNFHPENAHVIPSLMSRFHHAKINKLPEVLVWGTGEVKREFLYVDDMADASIFVLGLEKSIYDLNTEPMLSHVNVGTGSDLTIKEMAYLMRHITGFEGQISFDISRPDGPSRKLLDTSRLTQMGWEYSTILEDGLKKTYAWFLKN
jgi:GDP-L-fucose synthase